MASVVGALLATLLYVVAWPVTAASAAAAAAAAAATVSATVPEVQVKPLGQAVEISKTDGEKPVVTIDLTLGAGESRKLVGNVNATWKTGQTRNMDFLIGINCVNRATQAQAGSLAYAEVGMLPGETRTLRPTLLFTPTSAGAYTCRLVVATGTAGPIMTVNPGLTYLSASTADEVGSRMWQNPLCNSEGTSPTCTYLGEPGGPTQRYLLDNDGSQAYQWAAADSATFIGVTANVELTECGHTASCGGREHDGSSSTVSSHLEVVQLDALGNACNTTTSNEQTDVIGEYNHHFNIPYALPSVPVLATCGGSRNFRVRVDMRWVSGNSVKIDGTRPDPLVQTNSVAVNSFYAPTTATVPSVLGLGLAAAQSAIAAAHLNVGTVSSVANPAQAGTVLAQNAPANTVEPVNSPVNLAVSLGVALQVNPVATFSTPRNSVGDWGQFSVAQGGMAPYTWQVSGLPSGVTYVPSSGAISGSPDTAGSYVVTYAATDPLGNTGTGSFLWNVTVPVPDLHRKTPSQANAAISAVGAGLVAQRNTPDITVWDSSDGGRVVWQSPAAGTQVLPGQVIQYSIGRWGGSNR